jgi:hypothetical protein
MRSHECLELSGFLGVLREGAGANPPKTHHGFNPPLSASHPPSYGRQMIVRNVSQTIIADTPPETAPPGRLWFDSSSGALFIRYQGAWVGLTGAARISRPTLAVRNEMPARRR